MRERWAKQLALLTGVLAVVVSLLFARVLNPGQETARPETAPMTAVSAPVPASTVVLKGRAVFDAQGCARCHSIAGQGSPRSPLDGVGRRYSRVQLRQWVLAETAIRTQLSPRAIDAKQAYARLPADELDALLDYLSSLE